MTTLVEKKFFLVTAQADGHKVYYAGHPTGGAYWTPDPSIARMIGANERVDVLGEQLITIAAAATSEYIRGTVDPSTIQIEPVRASYFIG